MSVPTQSEFAYGNTRLHARRAALRNALSTVCWSPSFIARGTIHGITPLAPMIGTGRITPDSRSTNAIRRSTSYIAMSRQIAPRTLPLIRAAAQPE